MKTLVLTWLSLLICGNIAAQGTFLHYDVQNAMVAGITFTDISASVVKTDATNNLPDYFTNRQDVDLIEYIPPVSGSLGKALTLDIPLKGQKVTLLLLNSTFDSYEVVTSDGQRNKPNKEIVHYQGVIKDIPNSLAALTFYKDEIMGIVSDGNENYNIVKDTVSGKHFIYAEKNLKKKFDFECSTPVDPDFKGYDPDVLFKEFSLKNFIEGKQTRYGGTDAIRYVRFYIEAEYDIYQSKGSAANVEAYITGMMNQVRTLYNEESIFTLVSQIYIWTSDDPYTSSTRDFLLIQFQNYRTSFNGDLGMLLTFRNPNGGVAAVIGGLCSSVYKRLAVGMIPSVYENFPTYSASVLVITHEMGHLLGSRHTHACVWNGNNTAIDGCAGKTEGDCPIPGIPSGGGTIMSYCHQTSVGTNFALGFGPQPGNVIRNYVENASCLSMLSMSGAASVASGSNATYSVSPSTLPSSNYYWYVQGPGTAHFSQSGSSCTITFIGGGTYTVNCTIWSQIGTGPTVSYTVQVI
jgi:hypothetical protein